MKVLRRIDYLHENSEITIELKPTTFASNEIYMMMTTLFDFLKSNYKRSLIN